MLDVCPKRRGPQLSGRADCPDRPPLRSGGRGAGLWREEGAHAQSESPGSGEGGIDFRLGDRGGGGGVATAERGLAGMVGERERWVPETVDLSALIVCDCCDEVWGSDAWFADAVLAIVFAFEVERGGGICQFNVRSVLCELGSTTRG